jgi:hypothetical protein
MYYNYVRIHATLHMTPATAAGVTGKLWRSTIVALIEVVRGSYQRFDYHSLI